MLRRRQIFLLLPVLTAGIALQSCAASAPPPPPPPSEPSFEFPPPPLQTRIEPGRAVTEQMWGEISFIFVAQAGEKISLRVNSKSPGLDPNMSLVDPQGQVEAFDDDSGGQGNSLIKEHVLKKTGEYTVEVRSDGGTEGKVEVLLEKGASPGPP